MNLTNNYFHNKVLITIFLLLANCILGHAQSKISNERKQLFDYNWKFILGDEALAKSRDFDDNGWRSLDLPHDWSIEGKVNPKNPTGGAGGYFPAGVAWYRKTFEVAPEWKGKNVSVYFEGVYMNAEVFINGKSLGVRPYGYSSFRYNLSPYLDFNKKNVIAVRVDNSQQINSRWYSGSGIYRHVWMSVTDPVHVADWGVAITTPKVSPEKAVVQIKTLIKNETALAQRVILNTQLLTARSKTGSNKISVELPANSEKEITQTLQVTNPLLWSPDAPNLYQAHTQLSIGNAMIDETKTGFGIRSLRFTAEKGFQLNGETLKISGACVHHDNGCLGAAAFDRAEERKVELLKAAGFNAVRTSHNPPSEAFLNACDRLGLLVMDEAFDGWRGGKTRTIMLYILTNGGNVIWKQWCFAIGTTHQFLCGV